MQNSVNFQFIYTYTYIYVNEIIVKHVSIFCTFAPLQLWNMKRMRLGPRDFKQIKSGNNKKHSHILEPIMKPLPQKYISGNTFNDCADSIPTVVHHENCGTLQRNNKHADDTDVAQGADC